MSTGRSEKTNMAVEKVVKKENDCVCVYGWLAKKEKGKVFFV